MGKEFEEDNQLIVVEASFLALARLPYVIVFANMIA